MAATEIYTNNATTTVTNGGTTATSGSQTWTVASSAAFPAAATGSTQFHVGDPAAPSELIAVTNVSSNTWTVTRGAESTTPVAHAQGFTVASVITAGGLNGLLSGASGPLAVTSGGTGGTAVTAYAVVTGGTSASTALQAVSGLGSSGQVLTSQGAGALPQWSAIGTAASVSGTVAILNGGTGQGTAAAAYNALSPMTTTGDIEVESAVGVAARLAGNTSSTKNFLTSTGSGGTANAPQWGTIAIADFLPSASAYAVVAGGTSATSPLQQVAGTGNAGQALTSNSAGSLPTWQTITPNINYPTANGLVAWTYDPYPGGGGNVTLIAGTVYLQQVQVHTTGTVGSAWVGPQTAGSTPTSGQSWLGLYSQGGTLIAAGSSDSLVTSNAFMSVPLTVQGGQSLTLSPGSYYVAILVNATTMPQYLRGTGTGGIANFNNSVRAGTGGTGKTTLPGTVTPATTNAPISWWAGIS